MFHSKPVHCRLKQSFPSGNRYKPCRVRIVHQPNQIGAHDKAVRTLHGFCSLLFYPSSLRPFAPFNPFGTIPEYATALYEFLTLHGYGLRLTTLLFAFLFSVNINKGFQGSHYHIIERYIVCQGLHCRFFVQYRGNSDVKLPL